EAKLAHPNWQPERIKPETLRRSILPGLKPITSLLSQGKTLIAPAPPTIGRCNVFVLVQQGELIRPLPLLGGCSGWS
ncbi:hypothetical protein L195_g046299, partial [Trifolium pratense]